jgi:hypothetical protein
MVSTVSKNFSLAKFVASRVTGRFMLGMDGKYTGGGAVEGFIRGTSLFDVSVVRPMSNT